MNIVRTSIAIAVASLGLGTAAFAASSADHAPSQHRCHWSKSGSHDTKSGERLTQRQAALHEKLKLSPAQESAWKTFTDKLQATRQTQPEPTSRAAMTAPERADQMASLLQQAQQRAATRAQAVKEFYAALSPDQQRAFDSQFQGRHHHHDRA